MTSSSSCGQESPPSRSDRLTIGLVSLAIVLSCLAAAKVLRNSRTGKPREPTTRVSMSEMAWYSLAQNGRRLGTSDAPVVLVEFMDYACRYCAEMDEPLAKLLARFPDHVSIVLRYVPVSRDGESLARAAVCLPPMQFIAFHSESFQQLARTGRPGQPFKLAAHAGAKDSFELARCMGSAKTDSVLARDAMDASALGIRGTPVLYVNGVGIHGVPPKDTLTAVVSREVARLDSARLLRFRETLNR